MAKLALHDICTGGCLYPILQYFLVIASKALKKEKKTICQFSNGVRNFFVINLQR